MQVKVVEMVPEKAAAMVKKDIMGKITVMGLPVESREKEVKRL